MVRMRWSYADLRMCPTEHLVAIKQLLKDSQDGN